METIYPSYVRSKLFRFFLPLFLILLEQKVEARESDTWLSLYTFQTRTNDRLLWKIMSGDWNVSHPRIWVEWNTSDVRIANSRGLRFYGCSRLITRTGGFFASVKLEAVLRQRYSSCSRFRASDPSERDTSNARNPLIVDRFVRKVRVYSVAEGDFAWKKLGNASSIISFYTSGRFAEKRTSTVYCIERHKPEPPKDYANRIHLSN